MKSKPVVTSYSWDIRGQLYQAQSDAIERLGYQHHCMEENDPIPHETDIILVQGPYGPLTPLIRQLLEYPTEKRPVLVYWFQQSMDFRRPEWLRNYMGIKLSGLQRNLPDSDGLLTKSENAIFGVLSFKGKRLGYLGDILWMNEHGILDVFGLSSSTYIEFFNDIGIDSIMIPRGYHPSYGCLLNQKRDIALVWMGKMRTRRRKKVIYWLKRELNKRGLEMRIYDGKEADFIYGDERTAVLNRTWFVLNVYFSGPTDELSIRYYIAGANGTVVLTEPGENIYPFTSSEHIVECEIEDMPDTIQYYLENADEWSNISQNVYDLVSQEFTLEKSLRKLLNRAVTVLDQQR